MTKEEIKVGDRVSGADFNEATVTSISADGVASLKLLPSGTALAHVSTLTKVKEW